MHDHAFPSYALSLLPWLLGEDRPAFAKQNVRVILKSDEARFTLRECQGTEE